MATTLNEEKKYANQEIIDQALQALKNQEAVKPGQAVITCTPFFKFSTRMVSRNPVIAYFDAEYPVRPGRPCIPATEEIPTIEPLDF